MGEHGALPRNVHPERWPQYQREVAEYASWWRAQGDARALEHILSARRESRWFALHGVNIARLIPDTPLATRAQLQRFTGAFLGDLDALAAGYQGRTSGSTGQPVDVFMCPHAIAHYFLHLEWAVGLAGRGALDAPRVLYLSVATGAWQFTEPTPLWGDGEIVRLDVPDDERAIASLRERSPDILTLTPGALARVLDGLGDGAPPALELVLTTAEPLAPALRRRAADVFGCPVIDSYGIAEVGPLAIRCPRGERWHVSGGVALEVTPLGVAVTTLRNRAMPLARYLCGDEVEGLVSDETCPRCGASGQSFEVLRGRGASQLRSADGVSRSPLPLIRALMDARWPIARYQIVDRGGGRAQVRVQALRDEHLDVSALAATCAAALPSFELDVLSAPPLRVESGKAPALFRLNV